ncbi:MAG: hypothetical protein JWS10_2147 [Cypionkella sp.]|uniref:GIY-YIG nuclease family protein n=1 Tax=Cypionkella sp. TaxID=2811411 RepID=UPI00262824A1|nr:GIY-YIG nuclease family protein [Cypionkella sp.]MDB5659532.1 hypothetical protein [Cypionkella sp.]
MSNFIYMYYKNDSAKPIYIGFTTSPANRMTSHYAHTLWYEDWDVCTIQRTDKGDKTALAIESHLIRGIRPIYNITENPDNIHVPSFMVKDDLDRNPANYNYRINQYDLSGCLVNAECAVELTDWDCLCQNLNSDIQYAATIERYGVDNQNPDIHPHDYLIKCHQILANDYLTLDWTPTTKAKQSKVDKHLKQSPVVDESYADDWIENLFKVSIVLGSKVSIKFIRSNAAVFVKDYCKKHGIKKADFNKHIEVTVRNYGKSGKYAVSITMDEAGCKCIETSANANYTPTAWRKLAA